MKQRLSWLYQPRGPTWRLPQSPNVLEVGPSWRSESALSVDVLARRGCDTRLSYCQEMFWFVCNENRIFECTWVWECVHTHTHTHCTNWQVHPLHKSTPPLFLCTRTYTLVHPKSYIHTCIRTYMDWSSADSLILSFALSPSPSLSRPFSLSPLVLSLSRSHSLTNTVRLVLSLTYLSSSLGVPPAHTHSTIYAVLISTYKSHRDLSDIVNTHMYTRTYTHLNTYCICPFVDMLPLCSAWWSGLTAFFF